MDPIVGRGRGRSKLLPKVMGGVPIPLVGDELPVVVC